MKNRREIERADIIILEADGLIDAQNGYGYPIKQRLGEQGIDSIIVPIEHRTGRLRELPKKPLIISGGMTEVTADIEWINELKSFILGVIQENVQSPSQQVLGICFGAQIIAECFSKGSVFYLEDPEIGVSSIELKLVDHPLFDGYDSQFPAYSFHYNQIWSDELTVISEHHHKEHHFIQAFEIPEGYAYGVQFHPEFKIEEFLALLKTYRPLIKELGFDLEPIIESLPEIKGNDRFLKNFFELL